MYWWGMYGYDIRKVSKIFMPIHISGNHWILGVINYTMRRIELYDSMITTAPNDITKYNDIKQKMRKFIHVVSNKTIDIEEDMWGMLLPQCSQIPQQTNGHDCGIYVLGYMFYMINTEDENGKIGFDIQSLRILIYEIIYNIIRK
jgi:Ulp1 family protease